MTSGWQRRLKRERQAQPSRPGTGTFPKQHGLQTNRDHRVLIMRKLIAWAFMYSLDGLLADEGTEYWQFCFGLPVDPADTKQKVGLYQSRHGLRPPGIHEMLVVTRRARSPFSSWR
jgi:hypothetical protein